jgi:pimeloyl-ACP methyl ester carboxylesterase
MSTLSTRSGFVTIDTAELYYETAGDGTPYVMIHAGVADSRQWNHEFAFFANTHRVLRYDMRGYGRSEPAEGEFSHLNDLRALLDALEVREPFILMGCSMGGELAMDFAVAHPERVRALIMVDSSPGGLELDVPPLAKFAEAEKAWHAGDIDLLAEIETQIWFDGAGRSPEQVNREMRRLLYEMNHKALTNEKKGLGKRLPNTETPAVERLSELRMPVLVIVGEHDTPYILAAADYMKENLPSVKKVVIADAAHLPNMDQPERFQDIVASFLQEQADRDVG